MFAYTVRVRKVKCDEGRPACQRCVSTGRVCDGYGVWGGGGNGYHQRPISPKRSQEKCLQKPPTSFFSVESVSTKELEYLEWFACRSRVNWPGAFGSSFWNTLVLQASAREPAVLHALLALSAAHRSEWHYSSDATGDPYEQFALLEYTKAIHHLQPHFAAKNSESSSITMITCLIFVHLEFLRGHYKAGLGHLRSGIRLLREVYPHELDRIHDVTVLRPSPASENDIFEAFAHLNLQAGLFGQRCCDPKMLIKAGIPDEEVYKFESISHARMCLDRLLHGALVINECCRDSLKGDQNIKPSTLSAFRRNAQLSIAAYLDALENTQQDHKPMTNGEALTYKLLRIYHLMSSILIDTCLQPESEMRFDAYLDDFTSLVEICEEIQNAILSTDGAIDTYRRRDDSHSVANMGWIPPLYFVALKCRARSLRLRAIKMLRISLHKEGIWDAEVAATVAEEVMRLEEQGPDGASDTSDDGSSNDDSVPRYDTVEPPIPERQRLCFKVILPDDPWNNVRLICARRYRDGTSIVFERVFDVSSKTWRNSSDLDDNKVSLFSLNHVVSHCRSQPVPLLTLLSDIHNVVLQLSVQPSLSVGENEFSIVANLGSNRFILVSPCARSSDRL